MKKTPIRLAAAGITLAMAAVACGGNGDDVSPAASSQPSSTMPGHSSGSPSGTTGTTGATGADTAAADLRGALTNLLADHVWLAGNALETAVLKGGNLKDPEVQGAVKALDDNSVALSKAVGSAYPEAEKPFLASWRQHIGFFVDYTLGKATKDTAKVEKAKKDLDGYRTSFGQLINSVVPELPAQAVADDLTPHVATLFAAIDAAVAGSPDYQSKLNVAASHMPMTAATLAGGIAKNKGIEGDAASKASELRGGLTGLLNDHVWLAGNALQTAVRKGGNLKDPSVQGAVKALDENSVALSKAIGAAYPEAEKPFLASWRQHIGFFVDYTLGVATKDAAKMEKAKKDLDGYRTSFGQLINSVVPELPADAVADELKPHVATLLAAIDAMVKTPNVVQSRLAESTSHMPMTAEILATGIAKNKGL
ncbi:MAG TPA: hypothetical protein VGX28_10820 [Frankiaceae bacterium]|jgi:hypothetical protein|nr:hypothetical protein [Frankiaceae bacterium]